MLSPGKGETTGSTLIEDAKKVRREERTGTHVAESASVVSKSVPQLKCVSFLPVGLETVQNRHSFSKISK